MRLGAAALLPFLLTACAQQPQSDQGRKVYTLYNIVLAIALVIGFGVVGMILLTCVRYRKQPGDDTLPPQTHGNTTFEIIWTVTPTLVVLALFAMSFVTIRAIDKPASGYGAVIEVRGYQWAWTFDYGTNKAGTRVLVRAADNDNPPEMVVPVGEKIHIEERSDNVIHSFFVPAFLFKRDVVPGRANGFDLTVSSPGIYHGQCAEFCGTDHANMTFTVRAVGRTEFDEWFGSYKPPRPKCDPTGEVSASPEITSVPGQAEWAEKCTYVAAGKPFTIKFTNGGGAQHNLAVVEGTSLSDGKVLAATNPPIGSGSETLNAPALQAGKEYGYFCQVHPLMEGRFVLQ